MKRDTALPALHRAWIGTLAIGFAALVVTTFWIDPDGGATGITGALGPAALGVIALGIGLLAAEDFVRAGVRSELPERVGKVRLRATAGLRLRMALALLIAVGVPLALVVWVLALGAWIPVAASVLILGFTLAIQLYAHRKEAPSLRPDPRVREVLERLCFRADLRVPDSAVVPGDVATAWTSGGTIVVTSALLGRLDPPQLEAVLAHELAHLAHRDAPVMDVAAAPSRVLLSAWNVLGQRSDVIRRAGAGRWLAVFMLPYALPLAWISRIAMLSLSRARDLRADSAAAVLTGSPSALAAALLALDDSAPHAPSADLRAIRPLSVVDVGRGARWEWLALHPSTAARVERLGAMEETLQAGGVWKTPKR